MKRLTDAEMLERLTLACSESSDDDRAAHIVACIAELRARVKEATP